VRNSLLIFGRFVDDAKGVLAAINWLALVGIKRRFNLRFSIAGRSTAGPELRVAPFTNANHRDGAFDESQIASGHKLSLAHMPNMGSVHVKRHHYHQLPGKQNRRPQPPVSFRIPPPRT